MNNERFYESKSERALPSMMPKASINADVDAWLAQGGQIKTVKPVGSVEGELPPPNTAAARVLEMLRADALMVKREGANLGISNNQIAAGVHWLRTHGWRVKTVAIVGATYKGYRLGGCIMKHYHGTPISGSKAVAVTALKGGRAFIAHRRPDHLRIAIEHCVGFSVDNSAFSAWRSGQPIVDWRPYYNWVDGLRQHSAFDWAIIPDVIDGTESDNDRLLAQWPADLRHVGVPVWHMHESIERFARLCDRFDRVAIGSSGQFAHPCTKRWWQRMHSAMDAVCDGQGRPPCLLHGLRMLNQSIASVVPLHSADSTTLAINVGFDKNSTIKCRHERALFLRARIESITAVSRYERPRQLDMWGAA